jgi:hypothetical protein
MPSFIHIEPLIIALTCNFMRLREFPSEEAIPPESLLQVFSLTGTAYNTVVQYGNTEK